MEPTMIRRYAIASACSLGIAVAANRSISIAAMQGAQAAGNISLGGTGESRTPLAGGRWLLIGGERENGPVPAVSIFDPVLRTTVRLPARLHEARAWHSATILPDGATLVAG